MPPLCIDFSNEPSTAKSTVQNNHFGLHRQILSIDFYLIDGVVCAEPLDGLDDPVVDEEVLQVRAVLPHQADDLK